MPNYKNKISAETEAEIEAIRLSLEEQQDDEQIDDDELECSSEDLLPKTVDCEGMIRWAKIIKFVKHNLNIQKAVYREGSRKMKELEPSN